jgi:hypothetical protein
MPTEAELKERYRAYLNGQEPPEPKRMSSRVEEVIHNNAMAKKPVDYQFSKTVENFVPSAIQAAEDVGEMIMNPIDTATGLGKVALGAIQSLPGFTPFEGYKSPLPNYEAEAGAAGEYAANRWGGVDELKTTLMNDPFGLGMDAIGLASGGASLIPKAGKIGKAASLLDPIDAPIKAVGGMLDPVGMYKGSAKFASRFDADKLANTALDSRIMPTPGGIDKAQGLIGGLNTKIDDLISNSVSKGEVINANDMFKSVNDVLSKESGFKLEATKNSKKVQSVIDGFQEHINAKGMQNITAADVQNFKKEIYSTINWNSKQSKGGRATVDAKKAFARDAKNKLEELMPEIKDFNLKEGDRS